MTKQELMEKMKNGELPKAGIFRRTGAGKHVQVTTTINGKREIVPDINLEDGK